MDGRPEGDSPNYQSYDDYDRQAWQEFTDWRPWRPGDPSPTDETPSYTAASHYGDGRFRGHNDRDELDNHTGSAGATSAEPAQSRGRNCTEDATYRFEPGDQVRNQRAVDGYVFNHVQPGTRGEVLSTRRSLLGNEFATVRFENGYTEEVPVEDLKRRRWLD